MDPRVRLVRVRFDRSDHRQPGLFKLRFTRSGSPLDQYFTQSALYDRICRILLGLLADQFERFYRTGLLRKLGLCDVRDGDADLAQDLLKLMAENEADFTLTFRRLCDVAEEALRRSGELAAPELGWSSEQLEREIAAARGALAAQHGMRS